MAQTKELNPALKKYSKMGIIAAAVIVVALLGIWGISAMKRGVAKLLQGATSEADERDAYQQMVLAVRSLIAACETAGAIDGGANADDVLMLLGVLWQIPSHSGRDAQAAKIIALIFRGLGAKDDLGSLAGP